MQVSALQMTSLALKIFFSMADMGSLVHHTQTMSMDSRVEAQVDFSTATDPRQLQPALGMVLGQILGR